MIERIHQKLGTAGFVIAIVALIAALGGTALAAAKLNGTQKKEVEKIAKKYAGKPGAAGPAGPAGPAGAPGAKGDAGAPGSNGKDGPTGATGAKGTNGTNGTNGISVTTSAASEAECGKAGGTKFTSASPASQVCNGLTGFTDVLPSGKTETGTWGTITELQEDFGAVEEVLLPISFSIPLPEASEEGFVLTPEQIEEEKGPGFEAGCTGNVLKPVAPPGDTGVLCVYIGANESSGANGPFISGPEGWAFVPSGTFLRFNTNGKLPARVSMNGTWAVTAP